MLLVESLTQELACEGILKVQEDLPIRIKKFKKKVIINVKKIVIS